MDRDPRTTILSRRARFVAAAVAAAGIAAGIQKGDAAAAPNDAGSPNTSASASAAPLPPPTPSEIAAARALAEEARTLRAKGDHAGALLRLRKAYALGRELRLLLPIAEECAATDDFLGAIEAYEKLLASGAVKVPRDAFERRIAELTPRLAMVKITANVDGAAVVVDGVKVGVTPLVDPIRMNPGEHRIRVEQVDRNPVERAITVASGELNAMTFDMAAASPYPPPTVCLQPPHVCLSIVEPRPSSCACDMTAYGRRSK